MDSHQLDIALIDTLRANLPDYLFNGNPSMNTSIMNDPLLITCIILVICALIFVCFYNTKRPSNPLFAFVITSTAISLLVYFFVGIPKYQERTNRMGEEVSVEYLRRVNEDMARYGETADIGSRAATDHLAGLISCSDTFHWRDVCPKGTEEPYRYVDSWSSLETRITRLEVSLSSQMEKESRINAVEQNKQRIDTALDRQKENGE